MNTDEIPTAILIHMAITMDFPEILALCDHNEEFNKGVCLNKWFWKSRLIKDYDLRDVPTNTTPREYFSKVYKLERQAKKEYKELLNNKNNKNNNTMRLFDEWVRKYSLIYNPEYVKEIRKDLRDIVNKNIAHSPRSQAIRSMRTIPVVPVIPTIPTNQGGKTSPRVTLAPVKSSQLSFR